jgi:hypothetical protein
MDYLLLTAAVPFGARAVARSSSIAFTSAISGSVLGPDSVIACAVAWTFSFAMHPLHTGLGSEVIAYTVAICIDEVRTALRFANALRLFFRSRFGLLFGRGLCKSEGRDNGKYDCCVDDPFHTVLLICIV